MRESDLNGFQALLYSTSMTSASLLLWSWSLMCCWGWFAVPMGMPLLGLYQAAGVQIVIGVVTYHRPPDRPTEFIKAVGIDIVHMILAPLSMTLVGWIVFGIWG